MPAGLVSVVIPVFNGERYLEETLQSVLTQSYRSVNIIVVNDGSLDGTAAILARYGQSISCIDQSNSGPTRARNRGILAAQGEYLAFVDADDLWHEDKLKRQIELFHSSPDLEACVTHVKNFLSPELQGSLDLGMCGDKPGYSVVSLMARRSLFGKIGRFDDELQHSADTDWFLRVQDSQVRVAVIPEVLVYRRIHRNNRSHQLAEQSRREYLKLVKASLDRKRARPLAAAEPQT